MRIKFLPMESLRHIAEKTGVSPARVYSTALFLALFNLDPHLSGTAGERAHFRGFVGDVAARARQRCRAHSGEFVYQSPADLIYCKIEEWDHITA